ncbi:MAG: FeoA family protein [Kiritimatiellaeota bacterium]|nr:FeoA family protein [Kiritimatiellota bacterium]
MRTVGNTLQLDALGVGQSARLGAMTLLPAEQQRMAELGLTAGTPVVVTKRSLWGGPLELRVRGCKLSLRREVAQRIQVAVEQQHGR